MKFQVNGNEWKIIFVNTLNKQLMRSDGSYTLGVSDNNLKTVFISDNLSEYMVNKVLCHELTHIYCFEKCYSVDIETEEIIADFMSLYGRDVIYLADTILNSVMRNIA